MLPDILQRLREVNTLLATYKQDELSSEQALTPPLFYQDFNDTNILVKEAACLVRENQNYRKAIDKAVENAKRLNRTP